MMKTAPPRELSPLTPEQIKEIAPLNKDGAPDLMNYMPSRNVTEDEARQRKWPHFFEGAPCRYGHVAPRYVSNIHLCVDCFRIKRGKDPISQRAGGTVLQKGPRPYVKSEIAVSSSQAPRQLEPDSREKTFLGCYAAVKDFDIAARQAGMTEAQVMARMAWSAVFREAVNALELRLNINHTPAPSGPFEWDDDKRKRLIEIYVDTGDIATARDAIRVTPSEFFREQERNSQFADALLVATPLADNALEERAIQMALGGNDKLLPKVLSAKKSEYRESVKIDMSVTEKLTDEQLNAQLVRLYRRNAPDTVDAEFTPVNEPPRQIEDARGAEGKGPAKEPQPNSDLL